MFRCSGVFRYSGVPGFSTCRVFQCSSVPVFRCSGVPVFRCSGVPVFRCSGVPVFFPGFSTCRKLYVIDHLWHVLLNFGTDCHQI